MAPREYARSAANLALARRLRKWQTSNHVQAFVDRRMALALCLQFGAVVRSEHPLLAARRERNRLARQLDLQKQRSQYRLPRHHHRKHSPHFVRGHAFPARDARPRQSHIATWAKDIDDALRSYALTDEYPGEHELYLDEEKQRLAFFSAVDGALSSVGAPSEVHQQKTAELGAAAERFAATIRALTRLNADHAASEGYAIAEARKRVSTTSSAVRTVTLLLASPVSSWPLRPAANTSSWSRPASVKPKQRASELDMFAGRVAHDLRAPLTIIELKSSSGRRTDSVDLLHEALERIARQGRRMSEMIDTLLAFAQSGARPGGEFAPRRPRSCAR